MIDGKCARSSRGVSSLRRSATTEVPIDVLRSFVGPADGDPWKIGLVKRVINVNYSCRSATIILAGQSQVLFVLPSMNGPPVWGGARGG